jgi:hypothetical protein
MKRVGENRRLILAKIFKKKYDDTELRASTVGVAVSKLVNFIYVIVDKDI